MEKWSSASIHDWWNDNPWPCGFNYLPSTAVNFLEFWHPNSFDRETIKRELKWAADVGFNSIRVNLSFSVWQHDPDGILERFDEFLATAKHLGLRVVPTLFDDCGFSGLEPNFHQDLSPIPAVHNSRAMASPGRAALLEESNWRQFEQYVRQFISTYAKDNRVLIWDLYNEPGNHMVFTNGSFGTYEPDFTVFSQRLLERCFDWARDEKPAQPLTAGAWRTGDIGEDGSPYSNDIDRFALENSDLISFHAYCDLKTLENIVDSLERFDRPMLCTEWMARHINSLIETHLPILRQRKIGSYHWGLVEGKTQTYLPWPRELVEAHGGTLTRDMWFHDLLRASGEPYNEAEIDCFRQELLKAKA